MPHSRALKKPEKPQIAWACDRDPTMVATLASSPAKKRCLAPQHPLRYGLVWGCGMAIFYFGLSYVSYVAS